MDQILIDTFLDSEQRWDTLTMWAKLMAGGAGCVMNRSIATCRPTIRVARRWTNASPRRVLRKRSNKTGLPPERLAHKGCNTNKGASDPVVPWPEHLIVVEPASIIAAAERLERKGGREAMARCPTQEDAEAAAQWLVDRMSRLSPGLNVSSLITSTGGQYLISLTT